MDDGRLQRRQFSVTYRRRFSSTKTATRWSCSATPPPPQSRWSRGTRTTRKWRRRSECVWRRRASRSATWIGWTAEHTRARSATWSDASHTPSNLLSRVSHYLSRRPHLVCKYVSGFSLTVQANHTTLQIWATYLRRVSWIERTDNSGHVFLVRWLAARGRSLSLSVLLLCYCVSGERNAAMWCDDFRPVEQRLGVENRQMRECGCFAGCADEGWSWKGTISSCCMCRILTLLSMTILVKLSVKISRKISHSLERTKPLPDLIVGVEHREIIVTTMMITMMWWRTVECVSLHN